VKHQSRIYLDVESQKSAQEVGGWKPELMLFGLAVTHDDAQGYRTWYEKDIAVLVDLLLASDQVIGYNLIDFDFKLIAAYDRRIDQVVPKAVDLLTQISSRLGFRLKLDDVARATLGKGKTGDGMLSLTLWKQGRIAEVETYCKMDVELTKELHAHALQNGMLRYPSYGQIREVTIDL
jgi:DEAD/DEAH box helicase domain-containing protein